MTHRQHSLARRFAEAVMVVSLAIVSFGAPAHDFWLHPSAFEVAPQQVFRVTPSVGHADDLGVWPATFGRVVSLQSIGPDGVRDQHGALRLRDDRGALPLRLDTPGDHLIVLTGTHAVSELAAEKFNAYVAEEGIAPIAAHRRAASLEDTPGREVYSRRGKTLVRVAAASGATSAADNAHVTRPVGLTLEIVPLANPLDLQPGAPFEFEVLYRGQPVPGATIHRERLDKMGSVDFESLTTDTAGRAKMPRPAEGDWMLHVVWASRVEPNTLPASLAEYDTVFSSFTFGL